MKCPCCGSTAKYKESRRKYWGGHKGFNEPAKDPRTNFLAKCLRCGKEFDARDHYDVEVRVKEVEKNED